MIKFKYVGANAESFAGKNVAICFNDGTITIDEDRICECPPALEKALDKHPDYERLMPAVAPTTVKSEPKPKAKETPAPKVKAKTEPKPKPKVKDDTVVKQEAKKPESKSETTTPRRRRTRNT